MTCWVGPREAARRLNVDEHLPSPRPDGALELVCPAGSIECYLEWDRGTETRQRLHDKLLAYLQVHELWDYKKWPPLNLLFVIPGAGRLATLEGAVADLRENGKWKGYPFFTAWGLHAATAEDLARQGPLAPCGVRKLDPCDLRDARVGKFAGEPGSSALLRVAPLRRAYAFGRARRPLLR